MKNGAVREDVIDYITNNYGSQPEYLWESTPTYAVFRHSNKKWFAIIMNISKNKLGLKGEELVDILDVKCDFITKGSLAGQKGFFPAYHMNKEHWITVILDGSVERDRVFNLIDISYQLTALKKKRSLEEL